MEWRRVKWSEAGQVIALLKWQESPQTRALPPAEYFSRLVDDGRLGDAVKFLALALPRMESVAWAARLVRDVVRDREPESPHEAAMKAVLLWLQNPVESRRRIAFEAAQACDSTSPEAMAALAIFFSGGSVSPPDCEPSPAPHDAAGRFSAGAILLAAARCEEPDAVLQRALKDGEILAREGLKSNP